MSRDLSAPHKPERVTHLLAKSHLYGGYVVITDHQGLDGNHVDKRLHCTPPAEASNHSCSSHQCLLHSAVLYRSFQMPLGAGPVQRQTVVPSCSARCVYISSGTQKLSNLWQVAIRSLTDQCLVLQTEFGRQEEASRHCDVDWPLLFGFGSSTLYYCYLIPYCASLRHRIILILVVVRYELL
jgi:hypothetical protein